MALLVGSKVMKRWIVAVALIVAVAPPAAAQSSSAVSTAMTPERLAAAREVVELSRMRDYAAKSVDQAMQQMTAKVLGELSGKAGIDAKDKPKFDRAMGIYVKDMRDGIQQDLPKFIDAQAEIFASVYTLSELRGLAAFYRSPAGQAMVAKTPQLMQAVTARSYDLLIKPMMARMPATIEKVKAELAKPSQ